MHSGSHRLASYIAHVDRKYCSLFADNFWNTIVDQAIISDTGKSLKIYTMYLEICKKQVCFSHIITENCGKLCYESFFDESSVQSGSWENIFMVWFGCLPNEFISINGIHKLDFCPYIILSPLVKPSLRKLEHIPSVKSLYWGTVFYNTTRPCMKYWCFARAGPLNRYRMSYKNSC